MDAKIIIEVTQAELDKKGTCAAGLEFDLAVGLFRHLAPQQLNVVVVPETKMPQQKPGHLREVVNDQESHFQEAV
ncbi:hypothetical protein [Enterovibrio sp. 27052020O]|uniref:hypothetical protein n=1 Tax=Enterovibrio sp. 27052020O TaxID=3241166 RepID=UPI00388DE905